MKSIRLLILLFAVSATFFSCTKNEEDPTPDFSVTAVGTYECIRVYSGVVTDTLLVNVTNTGTDQLTISEENGTSYTINISDKGSNGFYFTIPTQSSGGKTIKGINLDSTDPSLGNGYYFYRDSNVSKKDEMGYKVSISNINYTYTMVKNQ